MIEVVNAGMLSTVQDLGRHGYTHLGISPAGAADPVLLRVTNLLVGNAEGAAAIEITGRGGEFRFHQSAQIAVGGDFPVMLDGIEANALIHLDIFSGHSVTIGTASVGLRGYLCVAGGIDIPELLDSRSTHLPSAFGGFDGRALRTGDRLPIGRSFAKTAFLGTAGVSIDPIPWPPPNTPLRVTPGPHVALFARDAMEILCENTWRLRADSNRMGIRLRRSKPDGKDASAPGLGWGASHGILTEGVPLGAIQVTPSGDLILLGVDAQTTGGYPILASLISADLSRMGQLRPGERIRFEVVSFDTARDLLMEQETRIYEWKEGL